MEQRHSLSSIYTATHIANLFLQDIANDYFCNRGGIQDEWEIMRICGEYERAAAKAEIARDLLSEVNDSLKSLFEDHPNHT